MPNFRLIQGRASSKTKIYTATSLLVGRGERFHWVEVLFLDTPRRSLCYKIEELDLDMRAEAREQTDVFWNGHQTRLLTAKLKLNIGPREWKCTASEGDASSF